MIATDFSPSVRPNKTVSLKTDLLVAGGGLAGVCAAITAARAGSKVVLIQDRPVLGGNASSEVRLWALGATSHMGNNNRWSREGGVIDEIMLDNLRKNSQGNALIFDAILLEKVLSEPNITLLLNTALYSVEKETPEKIKSVNAFCSQNSTDYLIEALSFCDATGDGILAFNAGASFRMGGESRSEFGEKMAPEKESQDLLGHSLFFYSKKQVKPVKFHKPEFAYSHEDIAAIPRCKDIQGSDSGCKFWWLEFGGVKDTIYESEDIKMELWKIVYGIWDYIKNSGKFDDVENLTLEWVGTVPGKRESRRFEGEYMLKQQDIVEQTIFDDAVSYGGWAIDLHPPEGIYSDKPPCSQFHSKGVYQIPYRCFISKDISNLFFAGRIISASHMAFGSTRVMITCAHGGQAVGEAANLCRELGVTPKALLEQEHIKTLQQRLMRNGQGIPHISLDPSAITTSAKFEASSVLALSSISGNGDYIQLNQSIAQLVPLKKGNAPDISINVSAKSATTLRCELRVSSKAENYTPDVTLKTVNVSLEAGHQNIKLTFDTSIPSNQYAFICFMANDDLSLELSDERITGISTVVNKVHKAVSNTGRQTPPENSGLEAFEFWTPERRPEGKNLALQFGSPLNAFNVDNLKGGFFRPWLGANAWVASLEDKQPRLEIQWEKPVGINEIVLYFDTDADHALETVLMEHPEETIPFCVRSYRLISDSGEVFYRCEDNHQTINRIKLDKPKEIDKLYIELDHPSEYVPASLFAVELR